MRLVTSLGEAQYHQYAKKTLEQLRKNCKLPVTVYTEDDFTIPIEGVETRRLQEVDGWQEFYDASDHIETDVYLWDVQRFSHKVFAQLDAFEGHDKYIVWIDADVWVKKELKASFLKQFVKEDVCAFLGRGGTYTETGIILFNTMHYEFEKFKEKYASAYKDRWIFAMEYWIDCMAFDFARKELLHTRNLTPHVEGMVDVFSRSPLAEHMTHWKGNRKYRKAVA